MHFSVMSREVTCLNVVKSWGGVNYTLNYIENVTVDSLIHPESLECR